MENRALAGRYALGRRVGTGGMADVFTARDIRLERDVAVKLFRPGTADGLERGSAEARLLASLDHPGLVRVLDMDNGEHAGDGAYLVMELVPGPDLGVLLRSRGPLGREGVRLLAIDLARTLQYIHGRGIVHRDVKPSNILTRDVDPHSGLFRYLLTDFGIARFFDGGGITATGQVIGSAAYFSPEQARGEGVGQPSDIYSLGLVMIEALTGERAFPGAGIESALVRLHRSPSIPHGAGPALSALLIAMTSDGPDDRPDASALVRALTGMGPQAGADPAAAEPPAGASLPAALPVPVEARPATASGDGHAAPWGGSEATILRHPEPRVSTSTAPAGGTAESTALSAPADRTSVDRTSTDRFPADHTSTDRLPAGSIPTDRTPTDRLPAGSIPTDRTPTDRLPAMDPGNGRPAAGRDPDRDDGDGEDSTRPVRPGPIGATSGTRRRRVLPWLVGVLVVALLAAALWAFVLLSGLDPAPVVEPLPAVPGEPGERLQELYESVQP